jgi:hypothetical protein
MQFYELPSAIASIVAYSVNVVRLAAGCLLLPLLAARVPYFTLRRVNCLSLIPLPPSSKMRSLKGYKEYNGPTNRTITFTIDDDHPSDR